MKKTFTFIRWWHWRGMVPLHNSGARHLSFTDEKRARHNLKIYNRWLLGLFRRVEGASHAPAGKKWHVPSVGMHPDHVEKFRTYVDGFTWLDISPRDDALIGKYKVSIDLDKMYSDSIPSYHE